MNNQPRKVPRGRGADLLISRARSAMPLRHVIPAVETLAFKPDAGALTVAVPTFTLHTGVVLEY